MKHKKCCRSTQSHFSLQKAVSALNIPPAYCSELLLYADSQERTLSPSFMLSTSSLHIATFLSLLYLVSPWPQLSGILSRHKMFFIILLLKITNKKIIKK